MLSQYGTGEEVYVATSNGDNRIIAFDSKAILSMTWQDEHNAKENFGVSLSRRSILKIMRSIRPKNGFYEFQLDRDVVLVFDNFMYLEGGSVVGTNVGYIGSIPYKEADPNRFNRDFSGLSVNRSCITGNVTVDYTKVRCVFDFLSSLVASGIFPCGEVRAVNFQIVNEQSPLIVQAYVKCGDILGNLDVAIFPFAG